MHITADGGSDWQTLPGEGKKPGPSCSVTAYQREIWLGCAESTSGGGWTGWVLHSRDAGKTWTTYKLPGGMDTASSTLAVDGLVATTANSAVMVSGGSLWRTTDGGATWSQSWPALPGEH